MHMVDMSGSPQYLLWGYFDHAILSGPLTSDDCAVFASPRRRDRKLVPRRGERAGGGGYQPFLKTLQSLEGGFRS
jgi:hypothetical protein